ncbi:uncharacterized protein LOC117652290 isoform X2 [Thrips palmi]|uniref:Uncharacterized protein LOC117652290 isoform X2 n=1 Tax=Thrips palmi TaxID=161013 RepID=A0A6P9A626_THRPL|nr:uncharacterized protein LOC117652290 isoform X2 [Thrips palmi]
MSYPNLDSVNGPQMSYGNQPGGYPGGPPGGYPGGYPGGPPGGPGDQHPGGVSPQVQQWFNAVDRDRSGKISAKELQAALVNGQGKNFSDQACNLMIGMFDVDESGMFDKDKSGTIDINEFQQLYNYVNQWLGTFRSYDRDQSGHIEEPELAQAFQQMGFRFTPEFIKFLITKSDMQDHAKISVDQFIVLCVQIQRFTDNSSEIRCRFDEPEFEKAKRKRKFKGDATYVQSGLGMGLSDQRGESESGLSLKHENETLREDMEQLVTENVHLIKENKQLQEENHTLKEKVRRLEEENKRLHKEHKDAIELSSWLSSAKEIVENLKKKPIVFAKRTKKPPSMIRPMDMQSRTLRFPISSAPRNFPDVRNTQWSDGEQPHTNGTFVTPHVKIERTDEDQQFEDGHEPSYHTPLLNFDQVEFHQSGKESCDTSNGLLLDMTVTEPVDDEVDRIGREQLLFPEPVEGVCELCPGSRIYVALTAMDNILSKKSHSSVARSCLEAIFKMPYLLSCSVQGNVAKGPYGKPDVQRPSLYRPAVESILKYARYHAEQNGWKVEENTTIKKQMNTRLSELRNIAKYKAQAAAVDAGEPGEQHKGYSRYKNIVAALSALPIVAQSSPSDISSEPELGHVTKYPCSKSDPSDTS